MAAQKKLELDSKYEHFDKDGDGVPNGADKDPMDGSVQEETGDTALELLDEEAHEEAKPSLEEEVKTILDEEGGAADLKKIKEILRDKNMEVPMDLEEKLKDMKNVEGKDDVDKVFNILIKCIHEVHHKDKIYNAVDVTSKDLETFVEQMTTSQLQSVMNFFDSMPKLRHVIQVTNPNTKKKGEVVVEGLQNFLG